MIANDRQRSWWTAQRSPTILADAPTIAHAPPAGPDLRQRWVRDSSRWPTMAGAGSTVPTDVHRSTAEPTQTQRCATVAAGKSTEVLLASTLPDEHEASPTSRCIRAMSAPILPAQLRSQRPMNSGRSARSGPAVDRWPHPPGVRSPPSPHRLTRKRPRAWRRSSRPDSLPSPSENQTDGGGVHDRALEPAEQHGMERGPQHEQQHPAVRRRQP